MEKRIYAVRGAVCVENTKESILEKTCRLFKKIVEKNGLKSDDLISIQFSLTKDIDVMNPATALRLGGTPIDISSVALFCTQEAYIHGGMEKVIRVMITTYSDRTPVHVYLDGAERLRPDFSK